MTAGAHKLDHFHGGLHLPDKKAMSTSTAIGEAFLPSRLYLPLIQHIGAASLPIVQPGEKVLKGSIIARADGHVSVPLHAPTSGTILDITEHAIPHPSGMKAECIVLEPDGLDQWQQRQTFADYLQMDPSALRNRIRDAGIVGLGGAGFPAFIKLNPGTRDIIDTLIINGAECEPYITCDDMLMRERASDIVDGIHIMLHALGCRHCLIGIEDNKPEAIRAMRDAVSTAAVDNIEVVTIPTIYPAGGEKQLIKVLTGKECPSHGLPLDVGIVCHNPGTAAAIARAILTGTPLISRIITVTGENIRQPRNFEVLLGTPVHELIEHAGGYTADNNRLLMGGPMMGFELATDHLPVIKTTNCILAMPQEQTLQQPAMPCIRCGACMDVCPANLLPQELYWFAHANDFDKIQDYHLFDCIECGCCSYVCPSHIPLVQYYRYAKTEIWAQERERQKSDHARDRHEFRLERLEREKREREERMRKKKAALKQPDSKSSKQDPKKKAIEEALERVKQRKQQGENEKKNTDNLTPEQQTKIRAVDRRRKKQMQKTSTESNTAAQDD